MKKLYIILLAGILSVIFPVTLPLLSASGTHTILDFTTPPNFSVTYDEYVDIAVSAPSDSGIVSIYVDNNEAVLNNGVFSVSGIPLVLGRNAFVIKVESASGDPRNYLYTLYRNKPPEEESKNIREEESHEDVQDDVQKESEVPTDESVSEETDSEPESATAYAPAEAQNPSSAPAGGFITTSSPVTIYKSVILSDSSSTASSGSSAPAAAALSSSLSSTVLSEDSVSSRNDTSVVLSSPYYKQVVTENSVKIGGSYDTSANISCISVNGQPCTLFSSSGTFTGPTLVSPGEARRKGVASDSSEYIVMDIDPNTHSGKNILKFCVKDDFGRTDTFEHEFYYYQLFVKANTYGESEYKYDDGTTFSLAVRNTQSYNKNLFYDPPYSGWVYPEKAYRDEDHYTYPYHYDYSDDMKAFYHVDNCPFVMPSNYGTLIGVRGHYSVGTKLTLHTPPLRDVPFILVLKNCTLFEYTPMFLASTYHYYIPNAISRYLLNGKSIIPINSLDGYTQSGYVIIDEFTPDTDYPVEFQVPRYGGDKGIQTSAFGYTSQYFNLDNIDTISADILMDSNNDGFLGGDDNACEMVSPGCVFWVNDDDDYDESKVHPDDPNTIPGVNLNSQDEKTGEKSSGHDYNNDVINGIRDLEDFMPINLTIPNIKDWANNQNVKFYLRTEGEGKIRVFKRINDAYLTELRYSRKQFIEKEKFLLPSDADTKNKGELLDASWFDSDGKFNGIFEGAKEGTLKLILEVELISGDTSRRVVLDEVYLTLKNVRNMYILANIRGDGLPHAGEGADTLIRYRELKKSGEFAFTDPDTVLIWAHGFNCSLGQSLIWTDTVFKRLYRTGYRDGFVGITWEGNVQFFDAWPRSLQTGQLIADIIKSIKTDYKISKINLSAHSLGNNNVSYALRLLVQEASIRIDNLILAEAAVPGNAFSGRTYWEPWEIRDFYDNMYGIDVIAVKGRIFNTYSTSDEILTNLFTPAGVIGVVNPLDDNYELVNKTTRESTFSGALGAVSAESSLSKFTNQSFYPPDYSKGKLNENFRPYGIRNHSSMREEYYYDVQNFYQFLITQEIINN